MCGVCDRSAVVLVGFVGPPERGRAELARGRCLAAAWLRLGTLKRCHRRGRPEVLFVSAGGGGWQTWGGGTQVGFLRARAGSGVAFGRLLDRRGGQRGLSRCAISPSPGASPPPPSGQPQPRPSASTGSWS